MSTNWARGSEWRKWDLHLHSPGTKLNDQFGGDVATVWDDYCRILNESDVQVLGIADYFSADGYLRTLHEFNVRHPNSSKLLIPNIELRTNDVVNKAQEEVNIHVLFNPFQTSCQAKIKSFLQQLKTNKTDAGNRQVCAAELSSTADYASATTSRHYIVEALEATFGKSVDRLDHVLIIAAANNDGLRPERGKLRKELITDELDKFSDAFFGNAKNVDYYLRDDRAEDKSERTRAKPVLTGSDAHSFADLEQRLGQVVSVAQHGTVHEPTWIKADPTYEGLKQIIYEPENRVFIGTEPSVLARVRERKTRYLESLHIDCVDGYQDEQHGSWFKAEKIPLGKELIAIIGNKGNGKSALTDIIGMLANSHNQCSKGQSGQKAEELFSFLNREKFLKGGCARHFVGTLNWYEGEPDRKTLDTSISPHLPEKVEYLPQKYLERICANIADDEFRLTLNEVIFRYVKRQDQYGQSSLEDLIRYLSKQAEEDISLKLQELHKTNESVVSVEKKLTEDYRKEIEERLRLKRQELESHIGSAPEEKVDPGPGVVGSVEATRITEVSNQIALIDQQVEDLEREAVSLRQTGENLRQIAHAIKRAADSLAGLEDQHQAELAAAGISFKQIVRLELDYAPLDAVISQGSTRLAEIEALTLDEGALQFIEAKEDATVESAREAAAAASLVIMRSRLEREKDELVERLGKPAREYQEYLKALALWKERERELRGDAESPGPATLIGLERELGRIELDYPAALESARGERTRVGGEIFLKRLGLTQFYKNVKESIDVEIAKCREHLKDYDISIEAGLRFSPAFFDEVLRYINLSAVGTFRGQDEGRLVLRQLTDTVIDWQDKGQAVSAMNSVANALHIDLRKDVSPQNAPRDVFKQMKGQRSPQELYDYLFGFEFLEPKYDLKVDGKDLSELSPGERGGLLLIFYLMLDRQDVPLIIDQPEDNLDNRSVYEILVTFIKEAKKRRQIILVTHNPNLAVVADAEQIIRVSIDKMNNKHDFDFYSGSIEDPRVNQALVDILEGTLPAFDNRRLKYRKQNARAV